MSVQALKRERRYGFDLLGDQVAEYARDRVEDFRDIQDFSDCPKPESEIERLLAAALCCHGYLQASSFQGVQFLGPDDPLPSSLDAALFVYVKPQVQMPDVGRVDFLIHAYDHRGRILRAPGWRQLVVECDGHDFHERTKEQAKRDRSRDRRVVLGGREVMRFTGSEIWNDPWGCAEEILRWAERGFG